MAAIGVLSYGLPPGLKLKNTNLSKISITTGNSLSCQEGDLKSIGMVNSEVGSMKRKQKLIPLGPSNIENIQNNENVRTPPAKKAKITQKAIDSAASVVCLGSGRKSTPLPQAVARRNARERNRVKQVNNGFATLRQHIPEEVAEAFEAAGNGRGSAKKLSKVETLRMAVEYIRSLERLLGLDNQSPFSDDSATDLLIKSELSDYNPISPLDDHYEDSNYDPDESGLMYTDSLPDVTTINGSQYLRIPGTNTYQLITTEVFSNEENFHQIINNNSPSPMNHLSPSSTTSVILAPAPISSTSPLPATSPAAASLSPAATADDAEHQYLLSQMQMHHQQQQQQQAHPQRHVQIKLEMMENQHQPPSNIIIYRAPNSSSSPIEVGTNGQGYFHPNAGDDRQLYDEGIVALKKETQCADNGATVILDSSTAVLSDESMMEAIDWWDAHTPKSESSVIM